MTARTLGVGLVLPAVAAASAFGVRIGAGSPDFLGSIAGHPGAIAAMVNTTGIGAVDRALPSASALMSTGTSDVDGGLSESARVDGVSRASQRAAIGGADS